MAKHARKDAGKSVIGLLRQNWVSHQCSMAVGRNQDTLVDLQYLEGQATWWTTAPGFDPSPNDFNVSIYIYIPLREVASGARSSCHIRSFLAHGVLS